MGEFPLRHACTFCTQAVSTPHTHTLLGFVGRTPSFLGGPLRFRSVSHCAAEAWRLGGNEEQLAKAFSLTSRCSIDNNSNTVVNTPVPPCSSEKPQS